MTCSRLLSAVLSFITGMGIAVPAHAQDTPCSDIYAAPVCVYLAVAGEDQQMTGEAEAMEFLRLMNARGAWNDAKRDLVRGIARNGAKGIPLTGSWPDGGSFSFNPPDAVAVEALRDEGETPRFDLAFAPDSENAPGNDEELKRMSAWLVNDLPAQQAFLLNWCMSRLHTANQQSNQQNAYKPYVAFIDAKFARIKTLPEAERPPVRAFLYRCAKTHDEKLNDRVPDFLYSFLGKTAGADNAQ